MARVRGLRVVQDTRHNTVGQTGVGGWVQALVWLRALAAMLR